MSSRILSACALLGFLILPATAQQPAAAKIDLRLLAFTPLERVDEAFAHDPAAADDAPAVPAEIKTYLNHEGLEMVLQGRNVVFTKSRERASIKRDDEVIARVTLPNGVNSAILLFLPGDGAADAGGRVVTIPDSKREFPAGSFRVSNLSPLPVQIRLEDKNYNFQPGQTRVIDDAPMRENRHSGMQAFAFVDNEPRRIASSLWPDPGDRRVVQVLYQHPQSGQIQMKAFDDIPPRDPTP